MLERVSVSPGYQLQDYERYAGLLGEVAALREAGRAARRSLEGRTVWHLSSTSQGGGVAEMLPRQISLLRQAGVKAEWVVIRPESPRFFQLTKHLHNLIHGRGTPELGPEAHALYQGVSRALADELLPWIGPEDLVIVHDPQPLGVGALIQRERGARVVWRCHIGLDRRTPATEAAWEFLAPWLEGYARVVFSLRSYVPEFLASRAVVIAPSIDPLSHKNREISVHKLTGVLVSAGLLTTTEPTLAPCFTHPALRLGADGEYAPACGREDLGLLFRPVVLQVSRWDRLKGFLPLLEAFVKLKRAPCSSERPERDRRRLAIMRLVLAGPDPGGVQDDPEAIEVLEQLAAAWRALPPALQADIAILKLPLHSRKENALMVNALQRCASIVVQNSLEEGFGLTVTEAMWKARPILGSSAAGLRAQVHDGIEGRLVPDPEDTEALAAVLAEMLHNPKEREAWGFNGRYRVAAEFHVLKNVTSWLALYREVLERQPSSAS